MSLPWGHHSSSENGGVVLLGVTPSAVLYTSQYQPSAQRWFQSAASHCLVSVPRHRIHSGMAVKRPWMFIAKGPEMSKAASHVPINLPTYLEVKHLLPWGLTQWALQVDLTSSIEQPYSSLTKTQRSCKSPVLTRCSWPPSPLLPSDPGSSNLVNYSAYLPFRGREETFRTLCPMLVQHNWFLFYEGLDPVPGKSLLLPFGSCCPPDPTYYFKATSFLCSNTLQLLSMWENFTSVS